MKNQSIRNRLKRERLKQLKDHEIADFAVDLAAELLREGEKNETLRERSTAAKVAGLITDPMGKAMTLSLADQVFRATSPRRCARQFRYLIDEYGIPNYLKGYEKLAMRLGAFGSKLFPDLVMPLITEKMRVESSEVILPAARKKLNKHLLKRRSQGIRVNINLLGEAILGECEAKKRLDANIELLREPDVTYISVKISNVFSQLNLLAFDKTILKIQQRLRPLFREAMSNVYTDNEGQKHHKFVNLDMEEYRDLQLTTAAFQRTLDEEEFLTLEAGIVLQSYLPDSWNALQELTRWSHKRVERGGAAIKIRLVKGANLAMETVEANLNGWEPATYHCKSDVDANYKRMVEFSCRPENAAAVRIGIASHNLFDIAYALIHRARNGVEDRIDFEMLEGMANHQAKTVRNISGGMLLYAPIVHREDFHSAIAYLVRRLDENTAANNFLRDLFTLEVGSTTWNEQRDHFLKSTRDKDSVRDTPYRDQDRSKEENRTPRCKSGQPFVNEPDTDWTVPANREWIHELRKQRLNAPPEEIPVVVNGVEQYYDQRGVGYDPSRPGMIAYRFALAKMTDVNESLDIARNAHARWSKTTIDERKALLDSCAAVLAKRRGELIAVITLDSGKSIAEADPEISEAIDFATYYARSFDVLANQTDITPEPLGCVVVAPPWNFPVAIACGGVLAAIMAGNAVILKPAPQAVLCGWHLAQALWDAGVPKDVLQFIPAPDNEIGRRLITSERTDAVILTGGLDTAKLFQSWKPTIKLFAETSGKNSIIISASADLDLAVRDSVKSAFGNAGQKCSAASLLIVEASVYHSEVFKQQLKDAAESLCVGSAWDSSASITPVIERPKGDLYNALTTLDNGEEWLLEPKMINNNPCLWSPGIRIGVKPGSSFHTTECFGPVLGVIRADSFEHAMEIQNQSSLGLTAGLHSLDPREIVHWRGKVEVGNAYINRAITGAIVNRQPFGGWKNSVFGPGAKAGGPNYTLSLCDWYQDALPREKARLSAETQEIMRTVRRWITDKTMLAVVEAAAESYTYHWNNEFSLEHDPTNLTGETNHFRYRPYTHGVLVRMDGAISPTSIAGASLAAAIADVPLQFSLPEPSALADAFGYETIVETVDELALRLASQPEEFDIIRLPDGAPHEVWRAANKRHFNIVEQPILANGRIELLFWTKEQVVSQTTHRYGNLIPTAEQVRGSAIR